MARKTAEGRTTKLEREAIRRATREAEARAGAPIADYATASFFVLDAAAKAGDEQAAAELARRGCK